MAKPRSFEWLAACVLLALSAALCGCAAPRAAPAAGADLTGGLVVVRLQGRLDPPAGVQLDVSLWRGGPTTPVGGRRQQSVPGRFADYLVSLPLRPGSYVISAIREVRDSVAEADKPGKVLVSLAVPFEIGATGPVYLGRWVVAADESNAAAPLEAQDHYDDDTLLFRSAIGALHDVAIGRAVLPNDLFAPTVPAAAATAVPENKPALRTLTVAPLVAGADSALAAPAREAFAKFMRLRAPRAFAVGAPEGRAYAYSSGAGAVERALRDCTRSSTKGACRLFAVDDSLMSGLSCGAAPVGAKLPDDALAACAAAARAAP